MKTVLNYLNFLRKESWTKHYDAVNWIPFFLDPIFPLMFLRDREIAKAEVKEFLTNFRIWKQG